MPKRTPKRTEVTFETVRRLALALPGVEEGSCYGTPGFRVRNKVLARLREDGDTLAVKCGHGERDFRLHDDPVAFFITEHYSGHPTVVVRLEKVDVADLKEVLEQAWLRLAPKRVVADYNRRSL